MKNILTIVMLLLISNQICFAESDAYKAYLAKHTASSENNTTVLLDQNAIPDESEIDPSAVVAVKQSKGIGADIEKPFMTKEMLANDIETNEYQFFYTKSLDIPIGGLQKKIVYDGKIGGYFDFIESEHKVELSLSNAAIASAVSSGLDGARQSAMHTISSAEISGDAIRGAGIGLISNPLAKLFLGDDQYIQVADYMDGESVKTRIIKYIVSDEGLPKDELKMIYDASIERSYHFNRGKAASLIASKDYIKALETYNKDQNQTNADKVSNYRIIELGKLSTGTVTVENINADGTAYRVKETIKGKANPNTTKYIILAALQKSIEHAKANGYKYVQIIAPDSLSNEKGFPINNSADIASYLVPLSNNPGGYLGLENSIDVHSSIDKPFSNFGSTSFEIVFKEVKNPKPTDIVWDTKKY
jgi:hypothetical protein